MNERIAHPSPTDPPWADAAPDWIDLLPLAADPVRLAILEALGEAGTLPEDDLRDRITDGQRDADPEGLATALHHLHLPALAERGLVSVAEDGGSVRRGPAFDAEGVGALAAAVDPASLDEATAEAVDDPRRRRVVVALAGAEGPVGLEALAASVVTVTAGTGRGDPVAETASRLHHVDLPKLEAAGIVEYDAGERTVSFDGLPPGLAAAVSLGAVVPR